MWIFLPSMKHRILKKFEVVFEFLFKVGKQIDCILQKCRIIDIHFFTQNSWEQGVKINWHLFFLFKRANIYVHLIEKKEINFFKSIDMYFYGNLNVTILYTRWLFEVLKLLKHTLISRKNVWGEFSEKFAKFQLI